MNLSTIGNLKVIELKTELEKRNISKSGTKSILVERLRQALCKELGGSVGDNLEVIAEDTLDNATENDDDDAEAENVGNKRTAKTINNPEEEDLKAKGTEHNDESNIAEEVTPAEDASLLDDDAIDYGDLDYGDEEGAKEGEIISFQIDDAEALSLDAPEEEKAEDKSPAKAAAVVEKNEETSSSTKRPDDRQKSSERRPNRTNEGIPDIKKMVWVSNLSRQTRALDLKTLFGQFGKVMSAKVVMNPNAKDAKCFGLITMNSESEAERSITRLMNHKLHERPITCERPRKDNAVLKKVRAPPNIGVKGDKKATSSRPAGIRPRQTSPEEKRKRRPIEAPSRDRDSNRDKPGDRDTNREKPGDRDTNRDKPGDRDTNRDKPGDRDRDKPGDRDTNRDKPGDRASNRDKPADTRERIGDKAKSGESSNADKDRRVVAVEGSKAVISVSLDNNKSKPESSRDRPRRSKSASKSAHGSSSKRSSPSRPRRRTRSPAKTRPSPRRRTRSPRPRRRSRSPRRHRSPPRRVDPPRRSRSPLRIEKRRSPPRRKSPSPRRRSQSRTTKRPRHSRSPRRRSRSPGRKVETAPRSSTQHELELLRAQTAKQEAAIKALMQGNMSNIGQMLGDKLTEKLASDLKSALVKQLQNTVKTMSTKAAAKTATEEITPSNPAKISQNFSNMKVQHQTKNIPIVPILQPLPPKYPTPAPASTPYVPSKPAYNPLMVSHKPVVPQREETRPNSYRTEPTRDRDSSRASRSDSYRSDARRSSDYRPSSQQPRSDYTSSHGKQRQDYTSHSNGYNEQRSNSRTKPSEPATSSSINDLLKSLQGVKEIMSTTERPEIPVQTYAQQHHLPPQSIQQNRVVQQQPIMSQQQYSQPQVQGFVDPFRNPQAPPPPQQPNQWPQYTAQQRPPFPQQQQQPASANHDRYGRR